MFMPLGMKTYDFNATGINDHHSFFYPASPAHEPFSSLFRHAPDVARELVRTLSNQATTAWPPKLCIRRRAVSGPGSRTHCRD
jgi:hypothetical protein